jgi:uncharacterized protein
VSATPTFKTICRQFAARTISRMTSMLLVVAALFFMIGNPALAEDDDSHTDFFSYLPAVPDINLPDIKDIVPFWTDDLKKAKKAYIKGDYDRAIKYFRQASDDGNIIADWYLGHIYREGRGVRVDNAIAYSYYSRVADAYDPEESDNNRLRIMVDGQLQIAKYQWKGVPTAGIKPNHQLAARTFLRIASNYGHPGAQYALGIMNIEGQGVKANPRQGLKWLIAAARKRNPEAEAYLGELYFAGKFVQRDETRALMWFILAKDSGRPEENQDIFERADVIRGELSDEQRLEAEARAKVWADQYPIEGSDG